MNGQDLSLQNIEASYTKAVTAELNREYERAFRLYLDATQNYMHLGSTSTNPSVRVICKTQAGKALERAEKIKHYKKDLEPVAVNHLSEQSQRSVLRKSSIINGVHFPLHSEPTAQANLMQPALSVEQLLQGASWQRRAIREHTALDDLLPEDIIQHIVSDCSVCASISVCIDHNRRFKSKLGLNALHCPSAKDEVSVSQPARYQWIAVFNGAQRHALFTRTCSRILSLDTEIDDQLPICPGGKLMSVSTGVKEQLIPSLLEKAYMTLMGGYDFPGSNSCIDLHAMTGWIPDVVDTRSSSFERERTWRRIVDGYSLGLCILTLGTGESLSFAAEMLPMSLKSAHCYAVIGIQDTNSDRSMTVLDSEFHEDNPQTSSSSSVVDDGPSMQAARLHILSWDTVCQIFDGIYLSWSPSIFKQTLTFHGSWRRSSAAADGHNHFQLTLRVSPSTATEEDVWVLLTRHVIDTKRDSEFIALSAQSPQASDVNAMYMKGSYTSSTHVLVKARVSSTNTDLGLVCSYDGDYNDVGFTVTVYSSTPASWVEDTSKMPYSKTISSSFTTKTAGGSPIHSSFMVNPQYHLHIGPDGPHPASSSSREKRPRMQLKVQGDRKIPFNITVVWSQGQRITDLVQNEIVATSGAYTHGFGSIIKDLPMGDYTIIVSAFEPRHIGSFKMVAEGTHRFELTVVPVEGAGMFSKVLTGAWSGETAAGGPSFHRYTFNPCYEVNVTSQMEVKVRLQTTDTTRSLSINATLFRLNGDKLGKHLTTSGPYSDARSGVVTAQVVLEPGRYAIVPSTYNAGLQASFKIFIYSTESGLNVTPLESGLTDSKHE